jgi:hypothetical protein
MAFWTVADRDSKYLVTFRQGEEVQDCGGVPHNEAEQLIGWLFHSMEGTKQYDHIQSPWCHGWVLPINLEKN